jgi:hypothetical protein
MLNLQSHILLILNITFTSFNKGSCQDVKSDCDKYVDAACIGVYEPWARAHCAKRCNYCGNLYLFIFLNLYFNYLLRVSKNEYMYYG